MFSHPAPHQNPQTQRQPPATTPALRSWALCGITPIHKGGDTQDPGNYRGIAVGSLLAKLYACILNELLMKWTEQHQLRARGQAGFRRDHRTTDQTFVVRTLIEKAKADRQPLYSCFVDFKKAYDTVPRDLLWEKLQRIVCLFVCFFTEGVLTKAESENKALRHNAASHV
jgi:Reverse transcriptase (RNA-dependent DNA polymerase)